MADVRNQAESRRDRSKIEFSANFRTWHFSVELILAPCINMGNVEPHAAWAVSCVRIPSRWRQRTLETLYVESNRR